MATALSVLVVSSSEKSGRIIAGLMNPSLCYPIQFEKSGSGCRRRAPDCGYDLIVVNTPLSDEFGHDLAMDLARETLAGVILLVKNDVYEEVCDRVGDAGVLTVPKPISSQYFHQTIRLAAAARSRLADARRENEKLKQKLDEAKLVGRAKCILVERRQMTEMQAHRYIEKRAMDTRSTRREVAEKIIRTEG
ncbi:MAG: ANTAR domain-containing protein [Lachnospiraceae bacterium]|nr:ANTAR domain-containing protein [Lachnospiraceae bacterium]